MLSFLSSAIIAGQKQNTHITFQDGSVIVAMTQKNEKGDFIVFENPYLPDGTVLKKATIKSFKILNPPKKKNSLSSGEGFREKHGLPFTYSLGFSGLKPVGDFIPIFNFGFSSDLVLSAPFFGREMLIPHFTVKIFGLSLKEGIGSVQGGGLHLGARWILSRPQLKNYFLSVTLLAGYDYYKINNKNIESGNHQNFAGSGGLGFGYEIQKITLSLTFDFRYVHSAYPLLLLGPGFSFSYQY